MTDSPSNPSVILLRDSDFTIPEEGDGIYFRTDPLDDPRITVRTSPDGAKEAVLWLSLVHTDDGSLPLHFGYPFNTGDLKGDALRAILLRIYAICSGGPAPDMIESLLAVAAGQPVTGGIETVESISAFGSQKVVVTDREVYILPPSTEPARDISQGSVLHPGKPLTSVVELSGPRSNPEWWRTRPALVFPGRMIHPAMDADYLCFPNSAVTMGIGQSPEDPLSFILDPGVGTPAYRTLSMTRQTADGSRAGSEVWTRMMGSIPDNTVIASPLFRPYVGPDGKPYVEPGPPNTAPLNALEVLMDCLEGRGITFVSVDASGVRGLSSFATLCSCLDDVAPLGAVIIISVDKTIQDTVDCSTTGGEASVSASLAIQSDHITLNPLNETIFLTASDRIP